MTSSCMETEWRGRISFLLQQMRVCVCGKVWVRFLDSMLSSLTVQETVNKTKKHLLDVWLMKCIVISSISALQLKGLKGIQSYEIWSGVSLCATRWCHLACKKAKSITAQVEVGWRYYGSLLWKLKKRCSRIVFLSSVRFLTECS